MKLLVETTGPFMLVQTTTGLPVPHDRPSVISSDAWVHNQLGMKHLRVLSNDLPDQATDKEFVSYWKECKGDCDLAVASFVSKFAPEPEPEPEPEAGADLEKRPASRKR